MLILFAKTLKQKQKYILVYNKKEELGLEHKFEPGSGFYYKQDHNQVTKKPHNQLQTSGNISFIITPLSHFIPELYYFLEYCFHTVLLPKTNP